MKKRNLLITAGLLGAFGSSTMVGAETGTNTDSSTAVVEFVKSLEEEELEIPGVDPGEIDPEHPDNPVPNPNPNGSLLRISFVSNFDFGIWGTTSKGIVAYAKAQSIHRLEKDPIDVVPFLTTIDNRGVERGDGWVLTAQATELTDGSGHVLNGAKIILANGKYENNVGSPTVSSETLDISSGQQEVATTDSLSGSGQWSLSLGELMTVTNQLPTEEDPSILESVDSVVTNGVRLEIPRNTITNQGQYSGAVIWELTSSI